MPKPDDRVRPDITYTVLPEHYEQALAADHERWHDARDAAPVWQGRRIWRLHKWGTSRALYRLMAFDGERAHILDERAARGERAA